MDVYIFKYTREMFLKEQEKERESQSGRYDNLVWKVGWNASTAQIPTKTEWSMTIAILVRAGHTTERSNSLIVVSAFYGLGDKLRFVSIPDVILCGWLGSKH